MTRRWVLTADVTSHPELFIGKEIIIGYKYSLIVNGESKDENKVEQNGLYDKSLFDNYQIMEIICKNGIVYALIEVNSMETAKQLHSYFIFKGMNNLPDYYNNRTYETICYMINIKIPDEDMYSFTQILPKNL